jgi:hypothetical protein
MKTYIYGENFLKTEKNLYMIKTYNMIHEHGARYSVYIAVKGYSDQKGKTNTFGSSDGSEHITELRGSDKPLFNEIKEESRFYHAVLKRFNIFK